VQSAHRSELKPWARDAAREELAELPLDEARVKLDRAAAPVRDAGRLLIVEENVTAHARDRHLPGNPEALAGLVIHGAVRRPEAHVLCEPRCWLTFWLTDGIILGHSYCVETRELVAAASSLASSREFSTAI
jgi:hypothetical protein